MEVIKLDGSTLCYMHRDQDGMHLEMLPNTDEKIKSGHYAQVPLKDCPSDCSVRIDISQKSYIAFLKSLMFFAEREEFVDILYNPMNGACWDIAKRKRGGEKC